MRPVQSVGESRCYSRDSSRESLGVVKIDKWSDNGAYEGIDVDCCVPLYPLERYPVKVVIVSRIGYND